MYAFRDACSMTIMATMVRAVEAYGGFMRRMTELHHDKITEGLTHIIIRHDHPIIRCKEMHMKIDSKMVTDAGCAVITL